MSMSIFVSKCIIVNIHYFYEILDLKMFKIRMTFKITQGH